MIHSFTKKQSLEKVDGTLELYTVKTGVAAIRLNAKKSVIYALYSKAGLLEDKPELHMNLMEEAERVSLEHDLDRMLYAIKSWELPKEAFVLELDEYPLDKASLELLREDVFMEINKAITNMWDDSLKVKPEEKAAEEETFLSEEIPLSTDSPLPEPVESI